MSSVRPEAPLLRKLSETAARFDELHNQLNDPAVLANVQQMVSITREAGKLEPVVNRYRGYLNSCRQVEELDELSKGGDAEMAELAATELPDAKAKADSQLES